MKRTKGTYAPLKWGVILPALLAIVLLAAGVCALHRMNAVSLRGTAESSAYEQIQKSGELTLESLASPDERVYALYEDEEKEFGLYLDDPWLDAGIMHVRGTLLRLNQTVGAVNVRVGLISGEQQEISLLNTQMVREPYFAGENGYDDHCGFHAAVQAKRLPASENPFRVAIADESDGAKRIIMTDLTIRIVEGELVAERVSLPESEEEHVQ